MTKLQKTEREVSIGLAGMHRTEKWARLAGLSAMTFAAMIALSYPQLFDPLVRWDDFPALTGDEETFFQKTLAEGRWLNYLWISREFLWPTQLNFLVYHAGWAVFAAACAICLIGLRADMPRLVMLSVLIALSPQAFIISGWFNTLIAGVWFIALFAVAAVFLSSRGTIMLYLVAAPVSMLFYSTFPFVLICLLALRHDAQNNLLRLVGMVILLGVGIALGTALMYSLNYLQFGSFDVLLADDRLFLQPATSLTGALHSFVYIAPLSVAWLFDTLGFGTVWLGLVILGLFLAAVLLLLRYEPARATMAFGVIAAFLGVVLLFAVLKGILIPMRSLLAVWIAICATICHATVHVERHVQPSHLNLALFVLVALVAGQFTINTALLMPWQHETRRIAVLVPPQAERIVVVGNFRQVVGADSARILHSDGLTKRLEYLTGAEVFSCEETCAFEVPKLQGNETDHFVTTRHKDSFVVLVGTP